MLPVGHFLLAATAAGLETAALEGFDESEVRSVVCLPANFTVPCIVAVGRRKRGMERDVRSPRKDLSKVLFEETYVPYISGREDEP